MEPDIKKIALNIAEDSVKMIIKNLVRPYAEYYIMQSENKIDDILLPFIAQLEAALISVADEIDGEEG